MEGFASFDCQNVSILLDKNWEHWTRDQRLRRKNFHNADKWSASWFQEFEWLSGNNVCRRWSTDSRSHSRYPNHDLTTYELMPYQLQIWTLMEMNFQIFRKFDSLNSTSLEGQSIPAVWFSQRKNIVFRESILCSNRFPLTFAKHLLQ